MPNCYYILVFLFAINISTAFAQVAEGNYQLILSNGLVLDAEDAHISENDCKVHLWKNNNNNYRSQVWKITPIGKDIYDITLAATGKALDAEISCLDKNGCKVHLWDRTKDITQRWKLVLTSDGRYIIVLEKTGKILDAYFPDMDKLDCKIELYEWNDCGDCNSKKWRLVPVNDAGPTINTILTSLPTLPSEVLWNKATDEQSGIIGSDFRGIEEIGNAAFERDFVANSIGGVVGNILSAGQLDNLNFWLPQKTLEGSIYKRTLSGKLSKALPNEEANPHIAKIEEIYTDFDLSIYIDPAPNYKYLLTAAKEREYTKLMATEYQVTAHSFGQANCDSQSDILDFTNRIETEIDAHDSAKNLMVDLNKNRVGQQISAYGPWVFDKGHCCHPEIHPAEQIWWSENKKNCTKSYYCNVFCDASKRFWWRARMDGSLKLKPWGAPPIKGTFAIAFEVKLGEPTKKFAATRLDNYNVQPTPNDFKIRNLVWNGQTLVSFNPGNAYGLNVTYENVGLKAGTTNIIHGFLVIETTVGKVIQKLDKGFANINNNLVKFNVGWGISPNTINQVFESTVFDKEEGHYMFVVSDVSQLSELPDPCQVYTQEVENSKRAVFVAQKAVENIQTQIENAIKAEAEAGRKNGARKRVNEDFADTKAELEANLIKAKKAFDIRTNMLVECTNSNPCFLR